MKFSKVPQIRFPEFDYELSFEKAGSFFKNRKENGEKGLPLYSVTIDQGLIKRDQLDRNIISETKPQKNLRAKPNDLVYNTMRMWQGAIGFSSIECMVSPAYVVLKPTKDIDSRYYFYFFKSHKGLYILKSQSYGLTEDRLRLYYKDFREIKFCKPKHEEQKKIASFLSVVDKKIEQLTQKKELLNVYKKGLLQKLFPKAGQQKPNIRFKDENGKNFDDWNTLQLGKIGELKTSSVNKKIEESETIIHLVNYMNVYNKEIITQENKSTLMQVSAKEDQIKKNNLKKGDILITPSSETPEDLGHSIVIFEDLKNTLYSYHLVRLRPERKINLDYSHYFFNTPIVNKQIARLASGSTRFTISLKSLPKVEIPFPSLKEQAKIAGILKKIDKRIELEERRIFAFKKFKKGLLQQMFV